MKNPTQRRPRFAAQAALVAAAGALACLPASAAVINFEFKVLGVTATFAEHSTLFTDTNLSTWQGGSLAWVVGNQRQPDMAMPLVGGAQPFTGTSPTGVQFSTPLPHVMAAPGGANGVVFADRLGWRSSLDGTLFPPFDTAPTRDNFMVFQPASQTTAQIGDTVRVGNVRVRNGSWHSANNGAPDPVLIDFSITLRSSDTYFDGFTLTDRFAFMTYAVQGGSADDNADVFYLESNPGLGAVRVRENGLGGFDLYARLGSLTLTRFEASDGEVFVTPTVGPIPEPSTWLLMAGGFAAIAWRLRHRQVAQGA